MVFLKKSLHKIVHKISRIGFWNSYCFIFGISHFQIKGLSQSIILRKNTSDRRCFWQIFIEEVYKDIPANQNYIIDLGANIGLSSVYFRKYNPCATILAIEPDPINFYQLTQNTSESGIICINKGVWDSEICLKINPSHIGTWGSSVQPCKKSILKSITIHSLLEQYNFPHIDILKIDIEGAEKYLFRENYDYWLKKTHRIAIELHDRFSAGCSANFFHALNKVWGDNYSLKIKSDILIVTRVIHE